MEEPWKAEEEYYQAVCRNCDSTLRIPLSVLATGEQMVCSKCKHIIYVEQASLFAAKKMSNKIRESRRV